MSLFKKRATKGEIEQDPNYPVVDGLHYLKVLAGIEDRLNPDLYLEIGSRTGSSLISRGCSFIAIDPVFNLKSSDFQSAGDMYFFRKTSDDFFESEFLMRNSLVPDLAFIDGMHHFENALKDFMNCERAMSRDGIICFHDVVPFNAEMTTRDENYLSVGTAWTGDVWKVVPALKKYRPDLKIDVLNANRTGLCCVSDLNPESSVLEEHFDTIVEEFVPIDLMEAGPESYFGKIDLRDPKAYLAELSSQR
ncbi:class I SAM-dependent methyltransferase [Cognatiyoonia sp. IB215446]|uniref:class I SAM-dependent methyltransferase n=1 Tax=Cognatiyoonia sp. IB215446 TaxID=3097355 RepID=UPI002A0B5B1A|nr:class I SAM-dependent methyltransferase [Cognatiyoonia sp. IB215446]MDX8346380.1 class I SAM-dependent methyltransferase [Cognatiyoonia sp. IB215446]